MRPIARADRDEYGDAVTRHGRAILNANDERTHDEAIICNKNHA